MNQSATRVLRQPRWLVWLVVGLLAAMLVVAGTLLYLKLHESALVFHTGQSRERATGQLPAGTQRLMIREPDGSQLAGLIVRLDGAHDSA